MVRLFFGFLLLIMMPGLAFGDNHIFSEISNPVNTLQLGKQIMITADVSNSQDISQHFAYLTQVKNENGVVISLSWLTGFLSPNQSLSPAQSWIPTEEGIFEIEVFVWESIENPEALSPPLKIIVQVLDDAV